MPKNVYRHNLLDSKGVLFANVRTREYEEVVEMLLYLCARSRKISSSRILRNRSNESATKEIARRCARI